MQRLKSLTRHIHTTEAVRMPRSAETSSFKFNHTMLRIKDPKVSLPFYQDIFGMDLIDKLEASDFTFETACVRHLRKLDGIHIIINLADFLAFDHGETGSTPEEKAKNRADREGVLELTHNHGTESDSSFKGYASGNSEPGKGFGHIAITCDDIQATCDRLEKLNVKFQKKLTDGKMKNIAFALDPDGYWIEIVGNRRKS